MGSFISKKIKPAEGNNDTKQEGKEIEGETNKKPMKPILKTKSKRKDRRKKRQSIEGPKKSNFPCCFTIPLDIAMEGFAMFDIVYFTIVAFVWIVLLALEPFAGRKPDAEDVESNNERYVDAILEIFDVEGAKTDDQYDPNVAYDERYSETSTTLGPPLFGSSEYDFDKLALTYSRIAYGTRKRLHQINKGCGSDYYLRFLFAYELDITRRLYEELCSKVVAACLLYVLLAGCLLSTLCCFRGYVQSKVFVILLWYCQLFPTLIMTNAIILSQSIRLCIFEYGFPGFKGQKVIFWVLVWPLILYKPYEIFIWSNYIKRYFQNKECSLTDESYFSNVRVEERQRRAAGFMDLQEHQENPKSEFFRHIKHNNEYAMDHIHHDGVIEIGKVHWRNSSSSSE